jgi:hypothetical protein
MYGIVNKAIENLVKYNFGADKWDAVKKRSGVDIDYFLSNEPYNDDITYKLAGAVSEEMNMPIEKVMESFGEWWVIKIGKEKYGSLIQAGGNNLQEFLINLPILHNRVSLIFPNLTPPEFKISDITEKSLCVHYYSKRIGLQEFVRGLLIGIGKMYETPVIIELLESRDNGKNHEIFKVNW